MDTRRAPLLAVAAILLTTGCDGAGDAADERGTRTVETPSARPTASPWPAFDLESYTYTLRTTCFCPDAGVPVIVTVREGKVVAAVYAHRGRGHAAGEDAWDYQRITIDDVIDAANNRHAYQVKVRWPEGQAYPDSVYVDRNANGADDEIGYSIRDVAPL